MEIFQKISQGRVLFLHIAKVYLGVEVDGAEHIAQLATVVFLNVRQRHIDLLADFVAVTLAV